MQSVRKFLNVRKHSRSSGHTVFANLFNSGFRERVREKILTFTIISCTHLNSQHSQFQRKKKIYCQQLSPVKSSRHSPKEFLIVKQLNSDASSFNMSNSRQCINLKMKDIGARSRQIALSLWRSIYICPTKKMAQQFICTPPILSHLPVISKSSKLENWRYQFVMENLH